MDNSPSPRGTTYGVPARRKAIAEQLSEAYSRDMLDQREFESRLERAEAAGTIEELETLVADFGTGASPASATPSPERTLTVLSTQNHIVFPSDNDSFQNQVWLGESRIDLRAYRGSGRTLTVRVSGLMSEVVIKVPAGTKVIRRSQVFLGESKQVLAKGPGQVRKVWDKMFGTQDRLPESPFPADGPPPTLILEGLLVMGELTIEEANL